MVEAQAMTDFEINRTVYDDADEHTPRYVAPAGVTEAVVRLISRTKNEPEWMLQKRLKGLELFQKTAVPKWGPDLSALDFDKITFFVDPNAKESDSWEKVPEEIRKTFDRLGIPEAERTSLGGVGAQYDSSVIYHNIEKKLKAQGVIFENMDVALHQYPELAKKYFMTSCIPINDHKFIMLHAAVWSGGTFIYVPKGVKVNLPLQAYFRMNQQKGGQFEHTLIIVDENAELHYIEGCSSPKYQTNSLHAGCVEIHVLPGAKMRYTSIENWSKNVYNLNTKRAIVHENAIMEWVNGNMGCLTGDSKILTNPRGPVPIESIKSGDKVYVWDEKSNSISTAKVKGRIFSGVKDIYKLEAGGREIEASANHPFLTVIRKKNEPSHKKGFFHFAWKPLEELRVNDVVGIIKKAPIGGASYLLPEINVGKLVKSKNQYGTFEMDTAHLYNLDITNPAATNEDFMWLMGLLVGDGHIAPKQNKINIATHHTEDYREKLCGVLKQLFNYEVTEKKERYIIINSKRLCELFTAIGFGGNADTKAIPAWVFSLPESQIKAFLAGYIDSDGHVQRNEIALTSVNKKLLEDVKGLAIMTGLGVSRIFKHRSAGIQNILGSVCNVKDSWRILMTGKQIKLLPLKSARKKNLAQKSRPRRAFEGVQKLNFKSKTTEEIGFARINKIVYRGQKPTYDIEVEKYHNFIANGLIVHNSHTTMLYPCSVLIGKGAKTDSLGIAFAGAGQHQDTGTKVIHAAPHTSSTIQSKSISKAGGISSYRGFVQVTPQATNSKVNVRCDALLIDEQSVSNTYPTMKIQNKEVDIAHEATVGKIGEEEIFYLQSRGLSQEQAMQMIVSGFIEPIVRSLPLEYAVELNKLIELEMEGSVG
ncbi:MAG TPA: Fe-S cluster assembly protein SufB [Candidatus Nanoarchaeia archaeon]|nr:Fe-S cluster assembly protein SufB [Candidatus Nanoarchaeia archaeon]